MKRRADAYGASFVSVHPFSSAAESTLLFGDYPRRTQEAFDFYRRYMAAAAYLGGKYVVIHGQPQGHGKLSDEGYWERFGQLYRLGEECWMSNNAEWREPPSRKWPGLWGSGWSTCT